MRAARLNRRLGRARLEDDAGSGAGDPTRRRPTAGPRQLVSVLAGHRRWVTAGIALTLAGLALGMLQPLLVQNIIESATRGPIAWATIAVLIGLSLGQAGIG